MFAVNVFCLVSYTHMLNLNVRVVSPILVDVGEGSNHGDSGESKDGKAADASQRTY